MRDATPELRRRSIVIIQVNRVHVPGCAGEQFNIFRADASGAAGVLSNFEFHSYSTSIAVATASAPPRHREATPRFSPRSLRAYMSVINTRAPLAPTGWPSAI